MCPKRSVWHKLIALVLASVLIVPILAACGKEKEETPALTPTQTSTAMPSATTSLISTPAVTPATALTGPVKIVGRLKGGT